MKRILSLLTLAATILSVCACDKAFSEDYIVDWYPVTINIIATDEAGNSVISPEMPGMSLRFQGTSYTVKPWEEYYKVPTKAYRAVISGLFAKPVIENGLAQYILWFGEIDGAADMDEDIVLTWPDGSTDTIHYHCSDHKEGKHPTCKRRWKLNGHEFEGSTEPTFVFSGKKVIE